MHTAPLPEERRGDDLERDFCDRTSEKRWVLTSEMTGTLAPPLEKRTARGVDASSATGKEISTGSHDEPLDADSSEAWLAEDSIFTVPSKVKAGLMVLRTYRQPGLLCTPRNIAQSSKFLGKKITFWYQGLPPRHF
jgi:hypothetical protein